MQEDDYDYEDDENVLGVVSIVVYKNDTYTLRSDLEPTDMVQLVVEVGDDLLDGSVEGLENISHHGMTKH